MICCAESNLTKNVSEPYVCDLLLKLVVNIYNDLRKSVLERKVNSLSCRLSCSLSEKKVRSRISCLSRLICINHECLSLSKYLCCWIHSCHCRLELCVIIPCIWCCRSKLACVISKLGILEEKLRIEDIYRNLVTVLKRCVCSLCKLIKRSAQLDSKLLRWSRLLNWGLLTSNCHNKTGKCC